jgi:ATP-dependent Clp protease ATP-binding subunit ClpA
VKERKGKEQDADMEPSFSEEDRRDAQLDAIFRTHFADLYRYIYRQVNNVVIAEDLTGAVFLKGSGATELIAQGVTFERMRGGIMFLVGRHEGAWQEGTPGSQPDFNPRTKKVLVLAGEEAQHLGETAISPHHLLVAILSEGQGVAAQLLQVSGVRMEQVGDTVHISVAPDVEERPITLPTEFQEALQQHPAAQRVFEKLSYSKKKSFVDRIERAEGEAARGQEVKKAIELLQQIHQNQQQ